MFIDDNGYLDEWNTYCPDFEDRNIEARKRKADPELRKTKF